MATIYTSKGTPIKVDRSDFALLSKYNWHNAGSGYAATTMGSRSDGSRRTVYMHRFLMGEPRDMEVDHINRDKSDNRRVNLRVCSHAENMDNQDVYKKYKTNKSGVAGVSFLEKNKKWRASFQHNGVRVFRSFSSKEDAVVMAQQMRAGV